MKRKTRSTALFFFTTSFVMFALGIYYLFHPMSVIIARWMGTKPLTPQSINYGYSTKQVDWCHTPFSPGKHRHHDDRYDISHTSLSSRLVCLLWFVRVPRLRCVGYMLSLCLFAPSFFYCAPFFMMT